MSAYLGAPGAPSDPATPGPYCLARCYCGTCPQYPEQVAAALLQRQQEYGQRLTREGQRIARVQQRRRQEAA